MANDIGNYARHAKYWAWGGHDRAGEHEYWLKYAARYGKNVLIPMCALGETGAYMAERGMNVTAFDITPEMIIEGKKQFGNIPRLQLCEGDVRDFSFDIPPADFCFCCDFGHLHTIGEMKRALACINTHLWDNGCLVIKTGLRTLADKSNYTPTQTFFPVKQVYPGVKVWKTGETRNDAETGRCYISQIFYAEDENGHVDSFDHELYMQLYYRDEWLEALAVCGFNIAHEQDDGEYHIFEAIKVNFEKKFRHVKINLESDLDYIVERHCRINYECDTTWARKQGYENYRAAWYANVEQRDGFLSALRDSIDDKRTIAEIIKTESGETVGYLWMAFHNEDKSFIWADVQDIYVEKAYRGTGVAKYLMNYAEQSAKNDGAKVIRSGTGSENTISTSLHQSMGYYQYRIEYEKLLREDL